jgi:hypothetical protein
VRRGAGGHRRPSGGTGAESPAHRLWGRSRARVLPHVTWCNRMQPRGQKKKRANEATGAGSRKTGARSQKTEVRATSNSPPSLRLSVSFRSCELRVASYEPPSVPSCLRAFGSQKPEQRATPLRLSVSYPPSPCPHRAPSSLRAFVPACLRKPEARATSNEQRTTSPLRG